MDSNCAGVRPAKVAAGKRMTGRSQPTTDGTSTKADLTSRTGRLICSAVLRRPSRAIHGASRGSLRRRFMRATRSELHNSRRVSAETPSNHAKTRLRINTSEFSAEAATVTEAIFLGS